MRALLILFFVPILSSSGQHDEKSSDVYEAMNIIITDLNLNKAYGLETTPATALHYGMSDKDFLDRLVIENSVDNTKKKVDPIILDGDTLVEVVSLSYPLFPNASVRLTPITCWRKSN